MKKLRKGEVFVEILSSSKGKVTGLAIIECKIKIR